jgi:hypothetical protein
MWEFDRSRRAMNYHLVISEVVIQCVFPHEHGFHDWRELFGLEKLAIDIDKKMQFRFS